MHGVDWAGIKKKYELLVPFVNHRADLTYILGEMIGELNSGHTYVGGGDMPKAERIETGLLEQRLNAMRTRGTTRPHRERFSKARTGISVFVRR